MYIYPHLDFVLGQLGLKVVFLVYVPFYNWERTLNVKPVSWGGVERSENI